jgi:nucleotidyltransferase AbiEii toxin of type IV toxin-antitoxin system
VIARLAPRFDKVPPAQRRLWPDLRPGVALGFVLYGGTAVSLHLGHRRSVDFDFFHDRPLDRDAIHKAFAFMRAAQTLQEAADTLVVLVAGSHLRDRTPVRVSFFGALGFGRVGNPSLTADGVAQVASLEDLLAHKLKVMLQRAERKDYQDIVAMLRAGGSLAHGLAAARLFFGTAFQPAASLKALTYFKDGDLARLAQSDREVLIVAAAALRELPRVSLRSRSLAIPL